MNRHLDFEHYEGGITAILTLTDDEGKIDVYRAAVDPEELAAFANEIGDPDDDLNEVGVDAPGAADWWWSAISARALGFDPNDKSPRAVEARQKWWNGKSGNQREYDRAMYLGVKNWGLLNEPAKAIARLKAVGKRGRERIHHRYRGGLWDAGRVAKKVGNVALKVAPAVLAAVPGIGVALGPAAMAAINLAQKVASSKVMKTASAAIKAEAKPGKLSQAQVLGAAARLAAAEVAADSGSARVAKKLIAAARKEAPGAGLFDAANALRKNVAKVATKPRKVDLVRTARAGRVTSNQGGTVTAAQLAAADKSGRVFYVNAVS